MSEGIITRKGVTLFHLRLLAALSLRLPMVGLLTKSTHSLRLELLRFLVAR
jgi:hypothetical protein